MDSLFQSKEWEQFKLSTGYQASYRIDDVLILQKNLPYGRSMLYSPLANNESGITNNAFLKQVRSIGKKKKAIFYRAEINVPIHNSSFITHNSAFLKSFEEMQPEHTLMLDISRSEEDILAQMKPKGRYNIKVARKNNVSVKEEADIENFFNLYATMAKRQNITYRGKEYYQNLFDNLAPKGYVRVFTAFAPLNKETHEPKNGMTPIASAIVSFYQNRATYLFGGSSDEHRNLMGPYLVQWIAILEAKKKGCKEYDFFGIAPDDNPKHKWAGVTRFKKQFGGEQVDLAGSWDLPLRPFEYKLFKIAERYRRR